MTSTASQRQTATDGSAVASAAALHRGWLPVLPTGRLLQHRRVIILLLHLVLVPLGYGLAFLLRFEGTAPSTYAALFWSTAPLLLVLRLGSFGVFRLFSGWWRHVGMYDLVALVKAVTLSSVLFALGLWITGGLEGFPRSILFLDWGIAIVCFGGMRFGVRWFQEGGLGSRWILEGERTLIIGAGDAAAQLLHQLRLEPESGIYPVGLVDDDPTKRWTQLHGVPVLGTTDDLERLVDEHEIELLVIAIASASQEEMRGIIQRCADLDVAFKVVPSIRELIDGRVRLSQLREVRIKDLLGRPPISLDLGRVEVDLRDKVVLITGGAGSIGAELARQVASFRPARLILLERAESPLYFVDFELSSAFPELDLAPIVGDVTNAEMVAEVFARYRPDYVFHAAAYKHVPMMERHLREAVRNNVLGTFRVARCAVRSGVRKFVLISTDKAVRPSSIMGATKRIAERVVLGWPEFRESPTDFRAVRFGNVLGSAGSVVPLFRLQIRDGGPVTVTHPEMTRYFMTVTEAVQLVLEAAALPEAAGRISMLEMGEPVRILDMAENLIRLSGLEPHTEIPIVFTGIRPGEKLREELMSDVEQSVPTAVEKIRVVQSSESDPESVRRGLSTLRAALSDRDRDWLARAVWALVPEADAPGGDGAEHGDGGLRLRRGALRGSVRARSGRLRGASYPVRTRAGGAPDRPGAGLANGGNGVEGVNGADVGNGAGGGDGGRGANGGG